MAYGVTADILVVVHLAFILFVAFGAVAVWKSPRLAWVHLPAVVWAVNVEMWGVICPLTPLEQWLRQRAGLVGYDGDFVARYVIPVIYPDALTRDAQLVIGGVIGVINMVAYALLWVAAIRRRQTCA